MTGAELRTALEGGQTLAQVAQSKGVSVDTVVNAIVAEIKTKLSEQVAAGRLTQAQADEKLANFEAELDAKIDSVSPLGKRGPRGTAPSGTAPSGASFTY